MTAAVGIQKMLRGRIVCFIRRLYASLSHHGIGIAHPEFGDNHHLGSVFICFNGSGASRAATADDEHIRLIIRAFQIHREALQPGFALQQGCQLFGNLFPLIGTHPQRHKLVFPVVGVEGL